jgi:hypothetical protein
MIAAKSAARFPRGGFVPSLPSAVFVAGVAA